MAGVKGMKHSRPRTSKEKDSYRLARIEQILKEARENQRELSKSQQFAIDLEYSKLRPTLAAVEQTMVDERDKSDPTVVMSGLVSKLAQKPELMLKILTEAPELQQSMRAALQQIEQMNQTSNVTH